jgi:hypothetical protein
MQQVSTDPVYTSLNRQVNHWLQAASRLATLDHLASGNAWHGIDHSVGIKLRESLSNSVARVLAYARQLSSQIETAEADPAVLRNIKNRLVQLRDQYLKAEETIHFYTVAINSRTTANVAALLRACDILCVKSMQQLLQPLGKEVPHVLTYVDKGVGASILKAGLRLWDGNTSCVAAIKVTEHNLFRPTAIIHETGHQVAHILNWNEELAAAFDNQLKGHPSVVGEAFASWASEIAADAFAFVHTGYASVAALHDVVSGSTQSVLAYHRRDPHPISYVRLLMNTEMCRRFYGRGPWDELEAAFKNDYNLASSGAPSTVLIQQCVDALPQAVDLLLKSAYRAFNNRSLSQLIPPENVSPAALQQFAGTAGPSLYTSHAWLWKECLRILALNGYQIGTGTGDLSALYKQQEEWMIRLGFAVQLN